MIDKTNPRPAPHFPNCPTRRGEIRVTLNCGHISYRAPHYLDECYIGRRWYCAQCEHGEVNVTEVTHMVRAHAPRMSIDMNGKDDMWWVEKIRRAANFDRGMGRQRVISEITHACPLEYTDIMPCCGKTPYEANHLDRITTNQYLVTCNGLHEPFLEVRVQKPASQTAQNGENRLETAFLPLRPS